MVFTYCDVVVDDFDHPIVLGNTSNVVNIATELDS